MVELRACANVRGEHKPRCTFTRDVEAVAHFVEKYNVPGMGVYFGVITRDPESRPPGTIATSYQCPALWIDNDVTPKAELQAALLGCYMPPSAIIDSGRGLHGYWLFDEPEDVSGATTNDHPLVETLKQLRRIFAGDAAVCDLARIMRLPGTDNTKYGEPRPCRVIHESDRRYSLTDLQEWVSWQRAPVGEEPDPFLKAAEALGVKPSLDIERLLAEMKPGNLHDTLLRCSAAMTTSGRAEDEIVAVLMPALKRAVGAPKNWTKEEESLRDMIQSAQLKFGPSAPVVDLAEVRRQKAGAEPEPEPAASKLPIIGKVAAIALEAWGRPVIIVDGELWTYAAGLWQPFDEHTLRTYIHQAARYVKSVGAATLNGAYRWIAEDIALVRHGVQWDRAGVIVGTNAALDLETGLLVPHSPDHYATRGVGCVIVPGAECPIWEAFLRQSLPVGTAETLQEWFGAGLIRGKIRALRKGLMVIGPSLTGKTQVSEVKRALIGGNTCGLHVRAMGERFGLQPLIHSSGWIADDACGQHEVMDAEVYKVVVTGENISVERKGTSSVECRFDMPVLLTMNSLPRIKDSSDAVYNRTLVLPMTVVCAEQDAKPIAEMVIAGELPGVLNWAVAGWHRLRERGRFDPPDCMIVAARDFKAENNHFLEFAELCLELDPHRMVYRDDIRDAFNAYLRIDVQARNGWSGKAIANAIKQLMPSVRGERLHNSRVWYGVKFAEGALPYLDLEFGKTKRPLREVNLLETDEIHDRHHAPAKPLF
jgi:P4 family phage/plasmid primase-like protien